MLQAIVTGKGRKVGREAISCYSNGPFVIKIPMRGKDKLIQLTMINFLVKRTNNHVDDLFLIVHKVV